MGGEYPRMKGVSLFLRWVVLRCCGRLAQHHRGAFAFEDDDAILVAARVTKAHNTAIRLGLGGSFFDDFGGDVERIAVEKRVGVPHTFIAEVGDKCSLGEIIDRDPDSKAKCEDPVDKTSTELGFLGVVFVEVQWLWVHGEGGKKDVVCFRQRSTKAVLKDIADFEFFKIASGHDLSSVGCG